jgi:hypothetical protein
MATCEVCGNTYDKTFQVTLAGERMSLTVSVCDLPACPDL